MLKKNSTPVPIVHSTLSILCEKMDIPESVRNNFGEDFSKELYDQKKLNQPIKEVKVCLLVYMQSSEFFC